MSGSSFSNALYSLRVARGDIGSELRTFTDVLGDGTVSGIQGSTFSTNDTGSITAVGAGSGVGLTVPSGTVQNQIVSSAIAAFGSGGDALPIMAADIESAFIDELAKATLTSTHTPVYTGTGTVVGSSISTTAIALGSTISNEGISNGFQGKDWPNFADAIADGQVAGLKASTGTVTIVGTPPPTPAPGVGTGSGSIT